MFKIDASDKLEMHVTRKQTDISLNLTTKIRKNEEK
jgi:hypothetical protein